MFAVRHGVAYSKKKATNGAGPNGVLLHLLCAGRKTHGNP
jgi:hypothetical protein